MMKLFLCLFFSFLTCAHANEVFEQFDDLKSQNWELVCNLGEKALQVEELTPLEIAQIHARLASSYFYLGDLNSMKKHISACQQVSLDLSSKQYLVRSLYLLSAYYRGEGLFSEAKAVIENAIELIESDVSSCLQAKVYFNAGAAHADDPDDSPEQVLIYYQHTLTLLDPTSNDAYRTQIRIAKSWLLLNNAEKAWSIIQPLFQMDLELRIYVHLLYVTAQIEIAQGNCELAYTRIKEALIWAEKLKMNVDIKRLNQLRLSIS